MANPEQLEEQREETRLIIEELLEDGSDLNTPKKESTEALDFIFSLSFIYISIV